MPAPYTLIVPPTGNHKDAFDRQRMMMTVVHNSFIRTINVVVEQAPHVTANKLQAFLHFCIILIEGIHHHHHNEEEIYFPDIEKRLGLDSMQDNVMQHKAFLPQMDDFDKYCKEIKAGNVPYDADELISRLNTFSDPLMIHLHDEIKTLDPDRLRKVFTEKELSDIEENLHKRAVAQATMDGTIPMFMVTHDIELAPWFNPLPIFVQWAVRYWFSRKYKESWEFGPSDFNSHLKKRIDVVKA